MHSSYSFARHVMWLVPLLYGVFLAGQEWRFRQALGREVPVVADSPVVPVGSPPNVQAVATVFGLTPAGAHAPSAEPMTLQASFVVAQGLSRALLADAAGARIYRVGERLPSGSVLRRVEADHVMLWRNGREERLALQQAAKPWLRRVGLDDERPATAHSSQYIRPVAGHSE
ncbi:type II secretion system protein N [Pseudomonas mediterranea]|uniref:type II secretion system protein N n=1 Tax=Pseudomonas mediterranea TaxID=183795 RepID=UPI003BF5F026